MIDTVSMNILAIWKQFLTLVTESAGSGVVETWLKAVSLHRWDALQKIAYIKAPNVFVKDWIERHYMHLFVEHLSRLCNVDSIKIIFLDDTISETPTSDGHIIPAQRIDMLTERKQGALRKVISHGSNYINESYIFDSFVVGPNNSLAYAASHAVTEHLGTLYNPLFIYGGSGLGKTHLLHAIGNKLYAQDTNIRILYQSAERFVHEFIYAIRFDKVHVFRERYKNIDMLLIDDVQFISNKEQTQEAFFHIFNSLYESNKQIVFSSDSYPADIVGLAGRLCSRFLWGLVTDIQIPSLETKIAILTRKAEDHKIMLDDQVVHYLAAQSVGSIRELEGALIRIIAYATLKKEPISLELVQQVIYRGSQKNSQEKDNFKEIVKILKLHYGISFNELCSHSREKQLSHVRHIAMYLMKKVTNKSLNEIGKFLKRKDHTTVLYGIKKIQNRIDQDQKFQLTIQNLEQEVVQL